MLPFYVYTYTILCMTKFQIYLKQLGVKESAKIFNISPRTALAYIRGDRTPRLQHLPRLIKSSNGKLRLSSFFLDDVR